MISILLTMAAVGLLNPEIAELNGKVGALYTYKGEVIFLQENVVEINGVNAVDGDFQSDIDIDPIQSTGIVVKTRKNTVLCIDSPLSGIGKSGEMQKNRAYTLIILKAFSKYYRYVGTKTSCRDVVFYRGF